MWQQDVTRRACGIEEDHEHRLSPVAIQGKLAAVQARQADSWGRTADRQSSQVARSVDRGRRGQGIDQHGRQRSDIDSIFGGRCAAGGQPEDGVAAGDQRAGGPAVLVYEVGQGGRVDLEQRKIDFEMAENTLNAPIGRKQRGAEPAAKGKTGAASAKSNGAAKPYSAPAKAAKVEAAPAEPPRRSRKNETSEAYFPADAAAKNAEVRKSREMKKALLSDAKNAVGKPAAKGSKTSSEKPSKHRKGPPKAGSASRKPKGKS